MWWKKILILHLDCESNIFCRTWPRMICILLMRCACSCTAHKQTNKFDCDLGFKNTYISHTPNEYGKPNKIHLLWNADFYDLIRNSCFVQRSLNRCLQSSCYCCDSLTLKTVAALTAIFFFFFNVLKAAAFATKYFQHNFWTFCESEYFIWWNRVCVFFNGFLRPHRFSRIL